MWRRSTSSFLVLLGKAGKGKTCKVRDVDQIIARSYLASLPPATGALGAEFRPGAIAYQGVDAEMLMYLRPNTAEPMSHDSAICDAAAKGRGRRSEPEIGINCPQRYTVHKGILSPKVYCPQRYTVHKGILSTKV
ncbi:hypothetical protein K438DRAFT_1817726 [Mycena galopus ATCC 62051]|nr:hypothetical protein K438DRAFT_1817726 [Mycena galopus ATCC 62051]